jgi:hypothetical protein
MLCWWTCLASTWREVLSRSQALAQAVLTLAQCY